MANIHLVGFGSEAEKLRDQIDAIMEQNGWATPGESATVIDDKETRWCGSKQPAPYLVIEHSKAYMAEAIGTVLHSALNLDTQIVVTHKYLARVSKPPEE